MNDSWWQEQGNPVSSAVIWWTALRKCATVVISSKRESNLTKLSVVCQRRRLNGKTEKVVHKKSTGNNTKNPKVTVQNQHFTIPWDLFHLTTQERACRNKLKAFVKTWKVTGGTLHLSHSVDQSDFFTTSRHQREASYWCPDVCRRPVVSRDASQRLAKLFQSQSGVEKSSLLFFFCFFILNMYWENFVQYR